MENIKFTSMTSCTLSGGPNYEWDLVVSEVKQLLCVIVL